MSNESRLLSLMEYRDSDLFWKRCESLGPAWNGRNAGKRVVGNKTKYGYNVIGTKVFGKPIRTMRHRLVYAAVWGDIPDGLYVDHIDGNKSNDHPMNLRLADRSLNGRNRKINANNKTGFKGIHIQGNRYKVKCAGKYFGVFESLDDAVIARNKAEAQVGGRFICR